MLDRLEARYGQPRSSADQQVKPLMSLLKLFVLSAELKTITAAHELALSPSLATRKLAVLERLVNVRLFQRTTRRIGLTEGGRILLPWAQQTLLSCAGIQDDISILSGRPSGIVRLVANHYAAVTAVYWSADSGTLGSTRRMCHPSASRR